MYEDVSRFLTDQTWRLPEEETKASGTTWLELFILFDTTGYRRRTGRTPKNAESAARSEVRKARNKHQRKGTRSAETAEPRASLAEELEAFTKVVRHTMRQDGDVDQAKWFHRDTKPQYRRLKVLGLTEHQPAIAANCEIDPITMLEIEEALQSKGHSAFKFCVGCVNLFDHGSGLSVLLILGLCLLPAWMPIVRRRTQMSPYERRFDRYKAISLSYPHWSSKRKNC